VAVAVQQGAPSHRLERQLQRARVRLARQKFLEQQRVRRQRPCTFALHKRRNLVAEAQQAARLEPDHRNAAIKIRTQRSDRSFGLATRLIDESHGKERSPAAERTATVERSRHMHAATRSSQHVDRRRDGLAFEVAIERVREQHDLPLLPGPSGGEIDQAKPWWDRG